MNYKKEYYRLIKYYQKNPISKEDCYCEIHHIIPRSCGGTNSDDNLVNLPAEIHYKVHCYLPFIYLKEGKIDEYRKMIYAWKRLLNSNDDKKILFNIDENAKEYKKLRECASQLTGQILKNHFGKNHPAYGSHWYKDPNDRTKSIKLKGDEPIPEGWVRGRWRLSKEEAIKYGIEHKIIHITNGHINKKILSNKPLPFGFWIGTCISEETKKKKVRATKDYYKGKRIDFLPTLLEWYSYFKKFGWDEFVKKYNYKSPKSRFHNMCSYYFRRYKNEVDQLIKSSNDIFIEYQTHNFTK